MRTPGSIHGHIHSALMAHSPFPPPTSPPRDYLKSMALDSGCKTPSALPAPVAVGPAVGQAQSTQEIAGSIPEAYQILRRTPTLGAPMCSGRV